METKGKMANNQTSTYPNKIMHQNHIEFTSPSKLQLLEGMEKKLVYKIVEQTFKPQARNALSIDCKTWI
jgi:hypothetical protein